MRRLVYFICALVAVAACDVAFPARGAEPSRSATAGQEIENPVEADETAEKLNNEQKLGLRVLRATATIPVLDAVVLVPDEASFYEALAAWSLGGHFPILIETDDSREDVARFIRAFQPGHVYRFAVKSKLPREKKSRREHIQRAVRAAWDCSDDNELQQLWKSEKSPCPTGLVVMSGHDPASIAGAALAAGRGEIIAWTDTGGGSVNTNASPDKITRLGHDIRCVLESSGYGWREMGDDIDAITICLNIPGKVPAPSGKGVLALTDVVGRDENSQRFAYVGWIFADTPGEAAYRAMCALFLQPGNAFLFDGYGGGKPWSDYSVAPAAKHLSKAGLRTRMIGSPNGNISAWRQWAAEGTDAELIHVNTSGNPTYFQLAGKTQGWARDIPPLNRPALVSMIHSWSATSPDDFNTLAGRWLAHGAYAYLGSVQEPYLAAFLPPELFTRRLLSGYPWGAAARIDNARPWKIQVIGDPLFILYQNHPLRITSSKGTLPGTEVAEQLRQAIKDRNLPEVTRDLVILGRDEDAAGLVKTVLVDETTDGKTRLAVARSALGAVFRAGDRDLFRRAYNILPDPGKGEENSRTVRRNRDYLWARTVNNLRSATDADLVLLARNLRWKRPDLDGIRLAEELARRDRAGEARALLNSLKTQARDEQARKRLEKALQRLRR